MVPNAASFVPILISTQSNGTGIANFATHSVSKSIEFDHAGKGR